MSAASVALIALGGAVGALLRFAITRLGDAARPWLIVLINVAGSFAAGVVAAAIADESWRLALLTGFCGGFTTFSTASADAATALRRRKRMRALWLTLAGVVVPVSAAALGLFAGQSMW